MKRVHVDSTSWSSSKRHHNSVVLANEIAEETIWVSVKRRKRTAKSRFKLVTKFSQQDTTKNSRVTSGRWRGTAIHLLCAHKWCTFNHTYCYCWGNLDLRCLISPWMLPKRYQLKGFKLTQVFHTAVHSLTHSLTHSKQKKRNDKNLALHKTFLLVLFFFLFLRGGGSFFFLHQR